MRRVIILGFVLIILLTGSNAYAWKWTYADYFIMTDVIELADKEYQGEFMYVLMHKSAFAFRLGYYRKLEDSSDTYPNDNRRWELGARWRQFFLKEAPNLLFVGVGFDNRPEDNTVTPTCEIGFNICLKPLAAMILGFGGYEVHWNDSSKNRDVWGFELRIGFCF